ncbi:hypothetical protein D2T29_00805 [Sinirhodobacter populi]|uniref:GS catalytic domain-containing protein n=2 Tax=Paenirhodobacter populi TaxID=2306993 RepID=A0A443KQF7_9RHOB|nr:hypothetical protein D2T29_00805 [Sinirhodobacter populi]
MTKHAGSGPRWAGNNRTHMVRVPGPVRAASAEGAVSPCLLRANIIAVGLKSKADPGPRYDIDMYAEGHKVEGAPKLPLNLLDAIRAYDADAPLKAAMGEGFSAACIRLKMQEWNSFVNHFSNWERENTLDI